ncbi:hypothetical protein P5G51_010600 [Virgibacillus sp. 179-BFC.A HS]|uniref:Uncharacterized protein n=1 Tax=Tigheibacillus jepli TaxID=3035914 RepID=A0ABU5CHJ3_9BACI|nr:hypothetical protein [Virgibacillus sp. 179-BFC.A HS]MDY0405780.1 hypothetical protein [Virgibacillus sp. 179-BFC.A HS]
MAFGIKRQELICWKNRVANNQISFLTHYWMDPRFPGCYTVTKAGCRDLNKLAEWGKKYGLKPEWIDRNNAFPHFDLFGDRQKEILQMEGQWEQLHRFHLS